MKTDLARGASAGAVGVWAMDVATWWMYRLESSEALQGEKRARPKGMDPAHAAARYLAETIGSDAAEEEPNAGGIAIHYLLGMAPGAAYARLRRRLPWLRAGRGAMYGAALFVMNDEIANRLLRLSGPQGNYPWQAHLRGLVGHVVLGVVTESTLNLLEEQAVQD